MAVFRAASGLDGDDAFHLHVLAAMLEPDLVGQVKGSGDGLVRELEDLYKLSFGQAFAAFEHLLPCEVKNGVASRLSDCFVAHAQDRIGKLGMRFCG
jgi:hypothetical protein